MTKSEIAKNYFMQGYNCAQAVFLAFAKEEGLSEDIALKIASSFGGGLGAQREVCGAVSGMCMALGLQRGYIGAKDYAAKQNIIRQYKKFARNLRSKTAVLFAANFWGLIKTICP